MNRATLIFGGLLIVALPLSLLAGRVWLDPASTPNAALILAELRLPRALLAVVVGAGLGAGGAAMQGYLRNPLAEPAVLGASNAAALGAVGALYFGLSELHALALPILAVLMGVIALVALFALAGHSESPLSLILAGIAPALLLARGLERRRTTSGRMEP